MPRQNRYISNKNFTAQLSQNFPPARSIGMDPKYVRGTITRDGDRLKPKNVWKSQDGETFYVQLEKVPNRSPSVPSSQTYMSGPPTPPFINYTTNPAFSPTFPAPGLPQTPPPGSTFGANGLALSPRPHSYATASHHSPNYHTVPAVMQLADRAEGDVPAFYTPYDLAAFDYTQCYQTELMSMQNEMTWPPSPDQPSRQ